MSLVQLHHLFEDGHSEACAQRDINSGADMIDFINSVKDSHPLPEGAMWYVVPESAKEFVLMAVEE